MQIEPPEKKRFWGCFGCASAFLLGAVVLLYLTPFVYHQQMSFNTDEMRWYEHTRYCTVFEFERSHPMFTFGEWDSRSQFNLRFWTNREASMKRVRTYTMISRSTAFYPGVLYRLEDRYHQLPPTPKGLELRQETLKVVTRWNPEEMREWADTLDNDIEHLDWR